MKPFGKILNYLKRKFCKHDFEELFSYYYYKETDVKYHPNGQVILKICKKCGWIEIIQI